MIVPICLSLMLSVKFIKLYRFRMIVIAPQADLYVVCRSPSGM